MSLSLFSPHHQFLTTFHDHLFILFLPVISSPSPPPPALIFISISHPSALPDQSPFMFPSLSLHQHFHNHICFSSPHQLLILPSSPLHHLIIAFTHHPTTSPWSSLHLHHLFTMCPSYPYLSNTSPLPHHLIHSPSIISHVHLSTNCPSNSLPLCLHHLLKHWPFIASLPSSHVLPHITCLHFSTSHHLPVTIPAPSSHQTPIFSLSFKHISITSLPSPHYHHLPIRSFCLSLLLISPSLSSLHLLAINCLPFISPYLH